MTDESRNQTILALDQIFANSKKYASSIHSPNTVDFSPYADVADMIFDEAGAEYEQTYTKEVDGQKISTHVQGFRAVLGEYTLDWSQSANRTELVLYKTAENPKGMLNKLSGKLALRLAKK